MSLCIGEPGNSIDSEQKILSVDTIVIKIKVIIDKAKLRISKFSWHQIIDIIHKSIYQIENTRL